MRRTLEQLAEAVHAIEDSHAKAGGADRPPIATGWSAVDEAIGGGLARGAIHEWFSDGWGSLGRSRGRWLPPLTILLHLARCAMAQASDVSQLIVWIGRRCWPHAAALQGGIRHWASGTSAQCLMPHASIFIDPPDDASRLWAIDLALRSPAVAAVIADGSNLDMAHTRRLQLAAAHGNDSGGSGAIGLLARPSWELDTLSAARTRWKVSVKGTKEQRHEGTKGMQSETHSISSSLHAFASLSWESSTSEGLDVSHSVPSCLRASVPSSLDFSTFRRFNVSPRWRIELLRCKGMRPTTAGREQHVGGAWTVEVQHHGAPSGVHLSADVADRSDPAAAA